jgi:hypothetical protein
MNNSERLVFALQKTLDRPLGGGQMVSISKKIDKLGESISQGITNL